MTKPVKVGKTLIGDGSFSMIAGPCSVESLPQFLRIASELKPLGIQGLRGGMFKLRTNPDSFQGLGEEAFQIAIEVKRHMDLPFYSEVTDPRQIEAMIDVVDVFQVGSRNMHNYALLKELGKTRKPILLKRGFCALIKEWLLAAEYIIQGGNDQIILCERGIRTFETAVRNTFDINAIAYIKQNTPFPILADPSHGTGVASLVAPISLGAIAAGADGLIVEVHNDPRQALSDGSQALNVPEMRKLVEQIQMLLPALHRTMSSPAVAGKPTNNGWKSFSDSINEPSEIHTAQ